MTQNNKPQSDMTPEQPDYSGDPGDQATPMPGEVLSEMEVNETGNPAMESFETDSGEASKTELAELKDKYIRLYADFENFRRRTARERLELVGTANGELMKSILPIVDDFERAMQSFDSTTELEPLKEGVALIFNKFYKTLESKGLKVMKTVGLPFDAELHESVAQFPAPNEELKGKVVDEVEKGYFLNDKVIRYAKVVVGG